MKRQTWQYHISYPQGVFFDFSEHPTPESHRSSRGGLAPGTPWSSSTQLLIATVCACALHAQLQTANVEISVYFPEGFLRSDSRVFLSSENNNEVRVISNDTQLKISVFGKYISVRDLPRSQKYSKLVETSKNTQRERNFPYRAVSTKVVPQQHKSARGNADWYYG